MRWRTSPWPLAAPGKGMSPYGFLSAALGACTSMTIRMYARRKGWPLDHVSVEVNHDKVHAQDAGTGTDEKGRPFSRGRCGWRAIWTMNSAPA